MFWRVFSVVVLACFWAGQPVFAAIGLHPYISVSERFNDNLFLEETGKDSDLITTIRPGIEVDLDYAYVEGVINYGLYFLFYLDNDRLNEIDPGDTQRASAIFTLLPGRDFTIQIEEEYEREQLDSRVEDIEENESFNRSNRNRFEVRPRYRREFRTFIFDIDAGYENVAFDSSEGNDLDVFDVGLQVEKNFTPRLKSFASVRYTDLSAEESSDFTRTELTAGAEYAFGPGWLALAALTPQYVDFDEDGSENYLGWNAELRRTVGRFSGTLSYSKAQDQANNDDGSFKDEDLRVTASISGRWQPEGELYYSNKDFFNIERDDSEYGAIAALRFFATEKLSFYSDLRYAWLEFDPEGEEVTRWAVGAGADYAWRRFTFGLTARYRENDSNFTGNDYENVIIEASASWKY